MSVASVLPFLCAVVDIDANHYPIVETVDKAVPINQVGKFCFQANGFPNSSGGELSIGILLNLQQFAAHPITAGDEHAIVWKNDRRGNIRLFARPSVVP